MGLLGGLLGGILPALGGLAGTLGGGLLKLPGQIGSTVGSLGSGLLSNLPSILSSVIPKTGSSNLLSSVSSLLGGGDGGSSATRAPLGGLLSGISSLIGQPGTASSGGLFSPTGLLGAGLLGAGMLQKEPGEVQEARQSVRNLLTPESQTGQFTGYVNGLNQQFQPLLTQQRQRGIEDIQQRFAAAFPGFVGAQGPEFGTLARYITDEALPREQALLGELGLQGLDRQLSAGRTLLDTAKPDPLAQLSTILGYDLLTRGQGGSLVGGLTGAGGASPISSALSSLGLGGTPQASGTAGFTPALNQVAQYWQLPNGQVVEVSVAEAEALSKSGIGRAGVPGASAGSGFQGLLGAPGLGNLQGVASGVGSGVGGFAVGQQVGQHLPNQATAALGGGASGAATGFAVGGPVGAVIGGIAGLTGGFLGKRNAQHEQKAMYRNQDLSSQLGQVVAIGGFFSNAMSNLGVETSGYDGFVEQQKAISQNNVTPYSYGDISGVEDQQQAVARVGGGLLLREIKKANPAINSLNDVPGLRQEYQNYLLNNTVTASNSAFAGRAPENLIFGSFTSSAGF